MFGKNIHSDSKVVEILLVEDNPGDARLAKEALTESRIKNNLHLVEDGELALDFLYKRGRYISAPHPDLILLDLNLPKLSGHQVLANIKSEDNLRKIPVVVLSISSSETDIEESYNLNANCYVTKSLDLNEFIMVFETIQNFWLKTVRLPS
jgi:chemotaxis family two-component system response regulator Rcp1